MPEMVVGLAASAAQDCALTLTLAHEDVLLVRGTGAACEPAVAAAGEAVERCAPTVGLRLIEPR